MRLIVTADLHYEFAQYRDRVDALAAEICRIGGDVLVVAGDTFAHDISLLDHCLRLFDGFQGEKLLVAGNHDLWTRTGDSFDLYDRAIPEAARACGFHDLDAGPRVVGDVGFVGTIGWYDYSFRDEALGVPTRFYEHKVAPGFARHDWRFARLLTITDDISPDGFRAGSRWMDGEMIRWGFDDRRFHQLTLDRLEAQLAEVEGGVRTIVAVTHHIPFAEMLKRKADPTWAFGNAFMGSLALGETLRRHDKVRHAVFGHSHARDARQLGPITALNVGCTYRMKRYDVIEL
ncbi:MAG TPA: metallophosphoesterase [Planctomycetota bacterium]|nr:metallophosphoesterase [Planctomycetota bacterium]